MPQRFTMSSKSTSSVEVNDHVVLTVKNLDATILFRDPDVNLIEVSSYVGRVVSAE